jgi:hypothetical protein
MNPAVLAAASALVVSAAWTMFVGWKRGVLYFGNASHQEC